MNIQARLKGAIIDRMNAFANQANAADPAQRDQLVTLYTLGAAGRQRLADFAGMLAPWRVTLARRVSRRGLLRGAGVATFAAMAIKED